MTTERTALTPTIVPEGLPEGFIPFSDSSYGDPGNVSDLADLAAQASAILNPQAAQPEAVRTDRTVVSNPETIRADRTELNIGYAESSPKGDVLLLRDKTNKYYAVIRGRSEDPTLSAKAAHKAFQTLAGFVTADVRPTDRLSGDDAMQRMRDVVTKVDEAVNSIDQGKASDVDDELPYDISIIQIITDQDGNERAVYANKSEGLIIQHDVREDPELISYPEDDKESTVISITPPLKPNARFILATASIAENFARKYPTDAEFFDAETLTDPQLAAATLLSKSEIDSEKDGRAAIVIDTAPKTAPVEKSKNKLSLSLAPITKFSKAAMQKRLRNIMGNAAAALKQGAIKSKEKIQEPNRKERLQAASARIGNIIKLSPMIAANKISEYSHRTKDWYGDEEKGSSRKRNTVGAVVGVLAVAALAGYLDSKTGGVASHHVSAVQRHPAGHKLSGHGSASHKVHETPKKTSAKSTHRQVAASSSSKGARTNTKPTTKPSTQVKIPKTTTTPTQAPATQPAAANTAPSSANVSLTPGSNPWVVARQSLQSSGNLNPTNAQIMVQDNAILAASHITALQATHLPVGFELTVPVS